MDNPIRTQVQELLSGVSQSNIVQTILGYIENNLGMAIGDRTGIEETLNEYIQNGGEYEEPISNYIASLIDSYSNNSRRGPSYQSARIWYQGKDHKDIWYNGQYHKALWMNKPSWNMNGYEWMKLHDPIIIDSEDVWFQHAVGTISIQIESYLKRGKFEGTNYVSNNIFTSNRRGGLSRFDVPLSSFDFYPYGDQGISVRPMVSTIYGPMGLHIEGNYYQGIDKSSSDNNITLPDGESGVLQTPILIDKNNIYYGLIGNIDATNPRNCKLYIYKEEYNTFGTGQHRLNLVRTIDYNDEDYFLGRNSNMSARARGTVDNYPLKVNYLGGAISKLDGNVLCTTGGTSVNLLSAPGDTIFETWAKRFSNWPEEPSKPIRNNSSIITLKELSIPNQVNLKAGIQNLIDKYCSIFFEDYEFIPAFATPHEFIDGTYRQGAYDIVPGSVNPFPINVNGTTLLNGVIFRDMDYYCSDNRESDALDFAAYGKYYRYFVFTFTYLKYVSNAAYAQEEADALINSMEDTKYNFEITATPVYQQKWDPDLNRYMPDYSKQAAISASIRIPAYLVYNNFGVAGIFDYIGAMDDAGLIYVYEDLREEYGWVNYSQRLPIFYQFHGVPYLGWYEVPSASDSFARYGETEGKTRFYRLEQDETLTLVKEYAAGQEVTVTYNSRTTHGGNYTNPFKVRFTGRTFTRSFESHFITEEEDPEIGTIGRLDRVNDWNEYIKTNDTVRFECLLPIKSGKLSKVNRTSILDVTEYMFGYADAMFWMIRGWNNSEASEFSNASPVIRCPFAFDFSGSIFWHCND